MADYAGVLVDLRARLAELDRERADLNTAVEAIERLAKGVNGSTTKTPVTVADTRTAPVFTVKRFTGLTMPQAVSAILSDAGEAMTTRQIQDALAAGGKEAKNRGHVYNTLHRLSQGDDGPFVRNANGRWQLRARTLRV